MKPITKLILPVAGLGKRLYPLTQVMPKNLLPVNGKPLIEYALEEAKSAAIRDVVFVVSPQHRAMYERYIENNQHGFPEITFSLREQKDAFGHGHALLMCEDIIGSDTVLVRFCDDIIVRDVSTLLSLSRLHETFRAPVVLLERVPREEVSRYGVVEVQEVSASPRMHLIHRIVEKPSVEEAPSNLTVVGGYVVTYEIMEHLARLRNCMQEVPDSILIGHGIAEELARGGFVYGWEFDGRRLDCGSIDGLQRAEAILPELIKTT